MFKVVNDLKKSLLEKGIATNRDILGCTEIEITNLEEYFHIRLPEIYKAFLRELGRSAGNYQVGTDIYYKDLFDLREAFEGILVDSGNPFILLDSVFVFSGHQGVIFHFFDTSQNLTDPPVYGYLDGDQDLKLCYESFSAYLAD